LVKPIERRDVEVVSLYEQVFENLPHFTLVPIDYDIARRAASIRAEYKILLPDAFQIAAALLHQATIFVANDKKLKRVKDICIACLKDYA